MPLIHIRSKKLEFQFNIEDKYTVLQGDSGVGKTTFYRLVSDMDNGSAGIQNLSDISVVAVPKCFETFTFDRFSNCVMVIDGNCTLFDRPDCASLLEGSDNYFIMIHRGANFLPAHVDTVFTVSCHNHFYTLKPFLPASTQG